MPAPCGVDVVVVTYQSARHVEACLASIPAEAAVFVVDNASTDDSADRARAQGAATVVNAENRGFAAAANQGAALGTSPLILFLNPDAVLGADALPRLADALTSDAKLGAVGPRIIRPDGVPALTLWPVPSPSVAWTESLGLHRLASRRVGAGPMFVVGTALLVRRPDFEALGGFDERFWLYGEDADLGLRMAQRGLRSEVTEDAVVTHIGGASGETALGRTFEHFQRGGELLVHKHHGRRGLIAYRLAVLMGAALRLPLLAFGPGRRDGRLRTRAAILRRSARHLLGPAPPPSAGATAPLVVVSLEAWDDVWRRNQFMVRELLAMDPHLRVLFVEPPYDLLIGIRHRARPRRLGLRAVDDGRLYALRPLKPGPRISGPWVDALLRVQVRRAARRLGFTDPSLWINDANYARLATVTGWPTLYDITDDWLEARATRRETARLRAREEVLLKEADEVVVCSEELARRKQRRQVRVIPNAVDAEFFRSPRQRPADLPDGPVAVYVGTLHRDRLDVDLVARLARESSATVLLVGPNALDAAAVAQLTASGVRVLGPKPYEDVPAYLQHADVIIVPHVVSAFTESLDPIKAYECLAVGRPTVVTPVAGLRDAGPPIVVAARDAFVQEVARLLEASPPTVPAAVPTWAQRSADFAEALSRARRAGDERRSSGRA